MSKQNFLLGKGERLIEDVVVKLGGSEKAHPYTLFEAKRRLAPKIAAVAQAIDSLPSNACPDDQAVASVTLNPEYIAKSFYPGELFKKIGVEPVGSRPKVVTPEKKSKGRRPEQAITTEYFVMGARSAFRNWGASVANWADGRPEQQLTFIEEVAAPTSHEKIKGELPKRGETVFEVVLHTDNLLGEARLLPLFRKYLQSIGINASLDRRFYAGGLCFVELDGPTSLAEKIAQFTPVRVLREMPRLRMLRPTIRSSGIPSHNLILPTEGPVDASIRTAIFDGGIASDHPLTEWANAYDAPGVGQSHHEYIEHGTHVTSAYLFGHLDPNKPVPRPFSNVDHYRVLDIEPGQNPHELYEVLDRIEGVLSSTKYDFINLSLGPQVPIEDDEVHAWTSVLDNRLGRSQTLATIAVGNDGEGDAILGYNRVQVPSDCVNALAVGACDIPDDGWKRAPYSSVGPGRSPGVIKPDLVDFGGSIQRPFLVTDSVSGMGLDATGGTSFAAPSVLRLAAGVRAHIGPSLSNLAIKALLVHTAEESKLPINEIGRGRVARDLQDILVCDDDTVRVVYQGTISPARFVRAQIPFPTGDVLGKVRVTATLCYCTVTDPHHPGNYTRSGLEISFRPHNGKRKKPEQVHADTKPFFGKNQQGLSEEELRRDAMKWENCIHSAVGFQGQSLKNPVFDIHYNSRIEGMNFNHSTDLSYALVVSVHAKNIGDLYDQIRRKYATQLEPLTPIIDIPVRT